VTLAVTLIVFPESMNSLTGALAVFGVAAAISVILLAIDSLVRSAAPPAPPSKQKVAAGRR
jgi:preprotein translocase subunit SecE